MAGLLENLSSLSAFVIIAAFVLHVVGFFVLWIWFRRDLRRIAATLDDFTRGLKHRSVLDSTSHLSDQIEAFLADVNDVLADPGRKSDRASLLQRMNILDEKRRYLDSLLFETLYNVARTMIEAYPLAGVMGTVFAIGAALSNSTATTTSTIVGRFGDAIWATFAGLVSAIILMFINSMLEPRFMRLAESRTHVRDTIARAKRELALHAEEQP